MKKKPWTRRDFIESGLAASLAARARLAASVSGLASAATLAQTPATLPGLDEMQTSVLRLAIDEIIPAADGMPAASEVGVLQYIGGLLEHDASLVESMARAIERLDAKSQETIRQPFSALGAGERVDVLQYLETNETESFERLLMAAYEGYYTRPEVWQLIGYDPHPTNTLGPTMTPFDPESLARVRELAPLYKEVQ